MPREINLSDITDQQVIDTIEECNGNLAKAARVLGVTRGALWTRYYRKMKGEKPQVDKEVVEPGLKKIETKDGVTLIHVGSSEVTKEDLIRDANVDMEEFEIERVRSNRWEVSGKLNQGQEFDEESGQLKWKEQVLWKAPLRQLEVKVKRKSNDVLAIQNLLAEIRSESPTVRRYKYPKPRRGDRRALEISIMDPHLGLRCIFPDAQDTYSIDDACRLYMWATETLVERGLVYGRPEEIVLPIGNDFLHTDGIFHTTTAGTPQPEMDPFHYVWLRGEQLLIDQINFLKEIAPVKVKVIPGNHDYVTAFCMGRVMAAYFHNDENVDVDASASSYKFWNYGCNFVGFEHGHSIAQVRMAAVMANENPEGWLVSKNGYREWHCGDQHRKGSSKPSAFEEQGVSIEYLPGLTGVNGWHRKKSYSWQKRGAMGWVWDYDEGPIARPQCNIGSYTGLPMGEVA